MKEVTYEEWRKNSTPRMMWVWDGAENTKKRRKAIHVSEFGIIHPVLALTDDKLDTVSFMHCAEIEEPKRRRMTNKELARWLREKSTREWKHKDGISVYCYCYYCYEEKRANEEVGNEILIREDDGEWREPLVEVEE